MAATARPGQIHCALTSEECARLESLLERYSLTRLAAMMGCSPYTIEAARFGGSVRRHVLPKLREAIERIGHEEAVQKL